MDIVEEVERMKEIIYSEDLDEIDKVYLVKKLNELVIELNYKLCAHQEEVEKLSTLLANEMNKAEDMAKENLSLKFNLNLGKA